MQDQSPGVFLALDDGYGLVADELLAQVSAQLRQAGQTLTIIDYAGPDMPSGYFIARYQAGAYENDPQSNPYLGVLLQVVDYVALAAEVRSLVTAGQVVLALNYATTAVAREALKFATAPERAAFFLWADQILFDTFGLPRPDKTYLLAGDSAEPSIKARVFAEMAGVLSRDLKLIDCYRNGRRLTDEETQRLLLEAMQDMLPERAVTSADRQLMEVWVPDLNETLTQEYLETMTKILDARATIASALRDAGVASTKCEEIEAQLTPLALDPLTTVTERVADVPDGYSQDHKTSRLLTVTPKNEHDLLPFLAYAHTGLSTSELSQQLDQLTFEQKEALLETLLRQHMDQHTLEELPVSYTFELLTTYHEYHRYVSVMPEAQVVAQALTPRYEYDLPPEVEENDLTDAYLECFDKSMELYSRLEGAGKQAIAANACLRGHKLRWRIHMTYAQLLKLCIAVPGTELVNKLLDAAQDRHPSLLGLTDQMQ